MSLPALRSRLFAPVLLSTFVGVLAGDAAAQEAPAPAEAAPAAPSGFEASRDAVVGIWVADFESVIAEMDEESRAMAAEMFGQAMLLTWFNDDGSYEMGGAMAGIFETDAGTWTVEETDGASVSVRVASPLAPEAELLVLTFEGADRFGMDDGAGGLMPFNRATEADLSAFDARLDEYEAHLAEMEAAAAELQAYELPAADPDFVATEEALHGTWAADFDALLARQEMSNEERAMAASMLAGALMNFTFGADGGLYMSSSMMGVADEQSGRWQFVSASGNVVTLTATTQEEGVDVETKTLTASFRNADFVMIADESGEEIPFSRAP